MHFLTILTLATSAAAGVAGGRQHNRPLWNQRGPVRAGHDSSSTNPTAAWPKATSGLFKAWESMTSRTNEAVEIAKDTPLSERDAESSVMHNLHARRVKIPQQHGDAASKPYTGTHPRPASYNLGQRSVEDDDDDLGDDDLYARTVKIPERHGDAFSIPLKNPKPRPASYYLGQRSIEGDDEDEIGVTLDDESSYSDDDEEDDGDDEDWDDGEDGDEDSDAENDSSITARSASPNDDSDEEVVEIAMDDDTAYNDEDESENDDDHEGFDDEDLDEEEQDFDALVARDVDTTTTGDQADDGDVADQDESLTVPVDDDGDEDLELGDQNEDDLTANEPLGDEDTPSVEPEEDTLDDTATDSEEETSEIEARDADPEPRRLFSWGRKPQGKVVSMVWGHDGEDDLAAGAIPQDSADASAAPPSQPAHNNHGSGTKHGHMHLHRREPEMQAGPA